MDTMQSLIDTLNFATIEYDKGHPIMSDKEWDDLYFKVQNLEKETGIILPNSPTNNISFDPVSQLKKVKHSHPMLSLQKTKVLVDISHFANAHQIIAMLKMDGLTCSLHYENGLLQSAETRGNGEIGEDITHNAMFIPSIPKVIAYKYPLTIDGEVICTFDDFEEFSKEYKNPRNFAAGSIRLLDPKECATRKLTFVAWDIIEDVKPTLSEKLGYAAELGFQPAPYLCCDSTDIPDLLQDIMLLESTNEEEWHYPIDGIVFKFNYCQYYHSLGATEHHPRGGIAFKFYDEEYETTLRDIEWTMGRTGVLTPVAIYDDIEIDGTICNRASLHNLGLMTETLKQPYVGQKIWISKMNQIIPQVVKMEWIPQEFKTSSPLLVPQHCPICGQATEARQDGEGLFLYCTNPDCTGKLVNTLDYFCSKKGLDIKGLSKATLEKLIEWNMVTSKADLFTLAKFRPELINKEGFGVKSVDKLLTAINDARHPTLDQFLASLGIPLIGRTYAKQLAEIFETYQEFRGAIGSFNFATIPGFGGQMHSALTEFDYTEADNMINSGLICIANPEAAIEFVQELKGVTFVVTGKLKHFKNRDELKKHIESRGGKVVNSVTTKTNYLINNDITSTSTKNQTAQKLNIPIITEEEYLHL